MGSSKSIHGIYLLGQLAKGQTTDKHSRYFPLPNICFARADDNTAVKIGYDAEGQQTQTPAKASLLFSDQLGKITAFTAPESRQITQDLPLQGNPALATNFESGSPRLLFFPPYLAPLHLLSESGKDGKWLSALYNDLVTQAEPSPKQNYFIPREIRDVQASQIVPSDKIGNTHYAKSIATIESSLKQLGSIRAVILPQQFTIVVHFSSAAFVGANVTLSNFPAELRIEGDHQESTNLSTITTVKSSTFTDLDGSDQDVYTATFWVMSDSVFALKEASQYCRFDIDLTTLEDSSAAEEWRERQLQQYSFCERVLHLPIQTPLGRSALVNGDPVSVEEALFNQAPHLYPDLLERLKQSPTDLPEKLASEPANSITDHLWHSVQINKAYIETGAQAMQHKLSWQTVAKVAAASVGEDDSELRNIAGATAASLAVMKKASEFEVTAAIGQGAIDIINTFGSLGNGLFDNLKNRVGVASIPPSWRALMQNMQMLEKIESAYTVADAVIKGYSLVEAYKKHSKAGERLDKVVMAYLATVQQPGKKVMTDFTQKSELSKVQKEALDELKKILPLRVGDEVIANAQVQRGQHLFELRSTTFSFDRSDSKNELVKNSLYKLGETLSKLDSPIPITINGYTCSRGSIEYNLGLSERRANFVKECILEGIGDKKEVWENCIKAIGYGELNPNFSNDSEENRGLNRRVDMILHFEAILDYPMSRGAITTVEKARQMSIADEMNLDKATLEAIEFALETALDVASRTPWGAATNFIYTVLKEGVTIVSNLYDLCTENADTLKLRDKLEQIQYQNFISQEQLLSFGSDELIDKMKASYYKRAHALNGLSRLVLEHNYQKMSGDKMSVNYDDIEGYIEKFLLNDQWQLNENGFGMIHLDEYYMGSNYASSGMSIAKASMSYAQLGSSVLYHRVDDWISDAPDDTPKPFMQYCPIHYRATNDISRLVEMFQTPFDTGQLEALYEGAKQSISVKTARLGAEKQWLQMSEFLDLYDSLSPYDEVRILVVLDDKAINTIPAEKRYLLHRVAIESQQRSYDDNPDLIINKNSEYIRNIGPQLKKMTLTPSEKALVEANSEAELWGAIIEPSFAFGINRIKGTRPWSSNQLLLVNDLFESDNREIRSGYWGFNYKYCTGIKGIKDSFKSVAYDKWGPWDKENFALTLSPSRLYQFGNSSDPKHADYILADKNFVLQEKPDSEVVMFPKVFDDPQVEFYINQKGLSGDSSDYRGYYKGKINDFNWEQIFCCLAVVKTPHCDDSLFTNAGFAPGKVVGVDFKLSDDTTFFGRDLNLKKTELFRIGTIVKKDGEWQFEAFTLQSGGKSQLPNLPSRLEKLRKVYLEMKPESLAKQLITNFLGMGSETDIYAQAVIPKYVNATGEEVVGLKPFKKIESFIDNFYYNVGLKLKLIGPAGSGLNAESEDSLELKLHSFDRESIPKTWYECSSDVTKAVEQIMLVEKDNYHAKNVIAKKYEKKYSDIYPAIRWFAAEEKGQSLISDEQLDIINDWIESR